MPIKCGGAPQKIMYLSEETWRKNGVRDDCDIHFYTSTPGMFPVPKYGAALKVIAENKGITPHFTHLIQSVDGNNRTAVFKNTTTDEILETDFDLLHIVPPQTTHKFLRESPLASANGMVAVDKFTLQHLKYPNVFSLGDCADLPAAKTAAGVFAQAPVVTNNLLKLH